MSRPCSASRVGWWWAAALSVCLALTSLAGLVGVQSAHAAPLETIDEPQLLAVEINGVQISRGAWVMTAQDQTCWVQAGLLSSMVDPAHIKQHTLQGEAFERVLADAVTCEVQSAGGLAQWRVPAHLLRQQPLRLGSAPASPLSYETIPSLAIDLLSASGRWGVGLTASHGLTQFQWQGAGASAQWSLDQLTPSGAQVSLGHLALTEGLLGTPAVRQSVRITNQARFLRQHATAHAELLLSHPSRIRMLDANGQQVYATSLLRPGRLLVEGFGVGQQPGIMTIEVTGLDGQRSQLLVPWVGSPLLLAPSEQVWELQAHATGAEGHLQRGLSVHETLRLGGALQGDDPSVHATVSSRRWAGWLVSSGLGARCAAQCSGEAMTQVQWKPTRQWSISSDWRHLHQGKGFGGTLTHHMGAWGSLQLQWSRAAEQLQSLSWTRRLPGVSQFQVQLRDAPLGLGGRALLLSMVIPFDDRRSVQVLTEKNQADGLQHQVAFRQRASGLQGESIGLVRRSGRLPSQELLLRSERSEYDLQVSARQSADQPVVVAYQASSRVWVTGQGIHLGRVGEQNLLLHDIGTPGIPVRQRGRGHQLSNAQGVASFSNVPAHSRAEFEVDQRRLPLGVVASGQASHLMTLSRRAYRLQTHVTVETPPSLRLPNIPHRDNPIRQVTDANGRTVAFAADGHLDWTDQTRGPLRIQFKDGSLSCHRQPGHDTLDCTPDAKLPRPSFDLEATVPSPEQRPG